MVGSALFAWHCFRIVVIEKRLFTNTLYPDRIDVLRNGMPNGLICFTHQQKASGLIANRKSLIPKVVSRAGLEPATHWLEVRTVRAALALRRSHVAFDKRSFRV